MPKSKLLWVMRRLVLTKRSVRGLNSTRTSARDSLLKKRLQQRGHSTTPVDSPVEVAPIPREPVALSPYQRPLWVDYRMYPGIDPDEWPVDEDGFYSQTLEPESYFGTVPFLSAR